MKYRTSPKWFSDDKNERKIEGKLIRTYFNKTQSLLFNDKSAELEEKEILKHIQFNNKTRILDLGCGNGRWAKIFADICKYYVGVDFSEIFIESAQKQYSTSNVEFYCNEVQSFRLKEKFDYIFLIGLITYMNDEDVIKLSTNCRKMLLPTGKLILRSVSLEENGVNRKVFDYKPNIIRKLLGSVGYQVIRRKKEIELELFNQFELEHFTKIKGTSYNLYVLK